MILNALRAREAQAIEQAALALLAGDLIGLPTETVYGLAADANNAAAVAKIFKAKDRPADHPLIVHVAEASEVGLFASEVPAFAQALMSAFWPGPLTLILPRRPEVAAVAAGGQLSIGLRCPSHPVAQALLKRALALGVQGVAAPSANRFGRVSPTTAAHVAVEFPKTETLDLLILDGGPCEVGIESSIVDCSRGMPVLLRPGGVSRAALTHVLSACGHPLVSPEQATQASTQQAPKASGTLTAHYAPRAQVKLMSLADMQAAWLKWAASQKQVGPAGQKGQLALYVREKPAFLPFDGVNAAHAVKLFKMPDSADASAHRLFADLRQMDEPSTVEIWVQSIPLSAEWEGVADRLRRAAA